MNKRLSAIIAIVMTIFLFAFSPAIFSNAATTTTARPVAYPTPLGYPVAHSTTPATPDGNKPCPSGAHCTYVADGIGGVQVFLDGTHPKLIASVPVKLTSSDPRTCPEGALYVSGVGVLVSDSCGNLGAGELRVLNPSTLTWGTPWTNAYYNPTFMIQSGNDIFVTNFGYSRVTVLTTSDTFVANYTTCGYYPEFLALDSSGNVYVGNQLGYHTTKSEYAGCIDKMTSSGITATLWGDDTNGPGAGEYFTGIQVVGSAIYVNVYDYSSSNGYGATFMAKSISAWSAHGAMQYVRNSKHGEYVPWGMGISGTAVYPISVYNYNGSYFSFTSFTFAINGTKVSKTAINLGPVSDFFCSSGASSAMEFPAIDGGSTSGSAILAQVTPPKSVAYANYYGIVDGYGCTSA